MTRPRLAATLIIGICLFHSPATAAIEADFITTAGTITVDLAWQQAPRTAANLITLAEGTRPWIDSLGGAVSTSPFFDGLPFQLLPDGAGGVLAAVGTRTGDGSDDPGYTIPDEIDPSLTHQPYSLTMIAPGPNRNGACLGFCAAAVPDRDGYSTVFGSVSHAPSRDVIDTILASPGGTVTLSGITIRRTDGAALAFDETAQGLPVVTALSPALQVLPGHSTSVLHALLPSRELRAHSSTDLSSWAPWFHRFLGADESSPGPTLLIDDASGPRRFYRFAESNYPDATGCSSLANLTLTIVSPETASIIYQFDATGLAGTYQNPIDPPFFVFEGLFEIRQEIPPRFGPYDFEILLLTHDDPLGGAPFNHIRGGLDSIAPSGATGRHQSSFLDPTMNLVFDAMGALDLAQP